MPLTELQIRSAKPQAKVAKLSDGGGLQLWVTPDGAKRWRLAYRFAGGQKLLAIGVYPAVGLKDARIARERARRLLSGGADPSDAKKQAKIERANASENSFASNATELIDKKRREGKAGVTVGKAEWLLRFALPVLGSRPVKDITAPDILAVLRKVESRGKLETAKRLRATIGQVFRYAVATWRRIAIQPPP
jgi:Arm DNA-binding domain